MVGVVETEVQNLWEDMKKSVPGFEPMTAVCYNRARYLYAMIWLLLLILNRFQRQFYRSAIFF